MSNRLADAHSPYLLQHKDNPVDWWPWSDEAFEVAARQDKPVFVSIGYSTCHWCHVMAHESFEDEGVARLMNDTFVNIKVDREERPDVDNLYMAACQMVTGHGGWPLTVIMTPDKRPFFVATYLPRESRHGRTGLVDLIPRIEGVWQSQRGDVDASAEQLTELLREMSSRATGGPALGLADVDEAYAHLKRRFDVQHGGFGTAPKFPSPHNLLFLLRYWKRAGEEGALRMVTETLDHMRRGGIYDHVGFGFHRYSTDAEWKLPHFEKMLYDQAMIALAYTEAYQATGTAEYELTAREIFTYVLRDVTASHGGFYSAEDADSEGREGKFYVWTQDELRDALDASVADVFIEVYNVAPEGNFEEEATRRSTGENVLYRDASAVDTATRLGMEEVDLSATLEAARQRLFERRETRVRPGRDDKILTDWNGLMIAALARAGRVFDDVGYAEAARRAAHFILGELRTDDGRLLHRYRDGESGLQASIDDYAFLIWGLIELYETTFDARLLKTALGLTEQMVEHYWDANDGGFFFSPDDGETLLVRQKEAYDGAVPSGNSVAMHDLVTLARLTGRTELEEKAASIGACFSAVVKQQPSGFTALLSAVESAVSPSQEVVLAGDPEGADTRAMLKALRSVYRPWMVVLLRPPGDDAEIVSLAPYVESQRSIQGKATAFVCRDFRCERPTTDVDVMLASLET